MRATSPPLARTSARPWRSWWHGPGPPTPPVDGQRPRLPPSPGRALAGAGLRGAARGLHGDDLYLACACAAGQPLALAAFDRQFLGGELNRVLARITSAPAVVEEVRQLCG
jgi:hypothetical protein